MAPRHQEGTDRSDLHWFIKFGNSGSAISTQQLDPRAGNIRNDTLLLSCLLHPKPAGTILTLWGRVTHICVVKLTIIGSDNGLSPGRRQAIIWTNAGILLIGPLGTNFIEILIRIQTFSFKKMHLRMLSAKWRPFGLSLNVLTHWALIDVVVIGPSDNASTRYWPPGSGCRGPHMTKGLAFYVD